MFTKYVQALQIDDNNYYCSYLINFERNVFSLEIFPIPPQSLGPQGERGLLPLTCGIYRLILHLRLKYGFFSVVQQTKSDLRHLIFVEVSG